MKVEDYFNGVCTNGEFLTNTCLVFSEYNFSPLRFFTKSNDVFLVEKHKTPFLIHTDPLYVFKQ